MSSVLLAAVLVPAAVYLMLAAAGRTGEPVQFRLAGRAVPAPANGLAAGAAVLPASFLFGLVGLLFLLGYDGLAYGLGAAGGLAVGTILIAPRLRASGAETVPDYFGLRFGATARVLAVLIVLASSFALLVAELSFAGLVLAREVGVDPAWMIGAVAAVAALIALPGGMMGMTWPQAAQGLVLAAASIVVLCFAGAKTAGLALPQVAYGEALPAITGLERTMLVQGLADARTLKPHVKPFLQIDAWNVLLLVLALIAGFAALPHGLTRALAVRSASAARFSGAWALLFVVILLIGAPAFAAFAKLEIYTLVVRGADLTNLPAGMEAASRKGGLAIHGVSLALFDDVIAARTHGASDAAGVAARLSGASRAAWSDLKPPVRAALVAAADPSRNATDAERWRAFQEQVLPAAARAAGNRSGRLTAGALTVEPLSFVFAIPDMVGAPALVPALLVAGAMAAMLATASALSMTMASALGREVTYIRLLLTLGVGLAAMVAVLWPPDPLTTVMGALTLAAAGLFPALVAGLWWRRANAWGAVAGMVLGTALALAYFIGTRYVAVDFYDAWGHLSNASEPAARKFAALKTAWSNAAEGEARYAAWAALEAHARGSLAAPGVANWFGVNGASAAVFGVPLGFLVIAVVSLVAPRASRTDTAPSTRA